MMKALYETPQMTLIQLCPEAGFLGASMENGTLRTEDPWDD